MEAKRFLASNQGKLDARGHARISRRTDWNGINWDELLRRRGIPRIDGPNPKDQTPVYPDPFGVPDNLPLLPPGVLKRPVTEDTHVPLYREGPTAPEIGDGGRNSDNPNTQR